MSQKRKNGALASEDDSTRRVKKSRRNYTEDDAQVAKIFDNLSSNDPKVRIEAAEKLFQRYSRQDAETKNPSFVSNGGEIEREQDIPFNELNQVISRLVRGLCSSRKSARHGYYIALTELCRAHGVSSNLQQEILNIVKQHTVADRAASSQV